ncbi:MAG: hypothetical protein GEV09_25545 [Pseudonocardiaceae bacterium]|nr:hypothetical protein [Pseudonocardiaceae bacterium]
MEEHELPTQREMFLNTLAELDEARNHTSEAANWVRSDWRPLGTTLTDQGANARDTVLDNVGKIKNLIDQTKNALHDAIECTPHQR